MAAEVVTYLEMTDPEALRPGNPPPLRVEIHRVDASAAPLVHETHRRAATPHGWSSLAWSKKQWTKQLRRPDDWSGIIRVDRQAAGLLVMAVQPDANVEITMFGLAPELVGRGFGGHALTLAVQLAWNTVDPDDLAPARRIWLHTSSLDHPHALPNYQARGFREFWARTRS